MEENLTYWQERARNIYLAYGSVTDYKNYLGRPMPEWNDLPEKIQTAWIAAAQRSQIDSANFLLTQSLDVQI